MPFLLQLIIIKLEKQQKMINSETVLVLGAGASSDFGFPLGFSLYKDILEILEGANGYMMLSDIFGRQKIEEFKLAYKFSGKESIDEFLEHRVELADIGKALISIAIIKKENEGELFTYQKDKHWYRKLLSFMNTSNAEDFSKNKISFVTFNYDRSLEHFLYLSLKNSYKLSDTEIVKIMSSIKIIHIHGHVGSHPCNNGNALSFFQYHSFDKVEDRSPFNLTHGNWDENKKYYRYYYDVISPQNIKSSMQNIKIIHDEENTKELKEAIELMDKAQRIIFLGFGYNETNLKRLKISECKCSSIWGTAKGMSQVQKEKITYLSGKKIEEDHLLNCTIYDFITNHMPLDFGFSRTIREQEIKAIFGKKKKKY